jgi:hypothetical protein
VVHVDEPGLVDNGVTAAGNIYCNQRTVKKGGCAYQGDRIWEKGPFNPIEIEIGSKRFPFLFWAEL